MTSKSMQRLKREAEERYPWPNSAAVDTETATRQAQVTEGERRAFITARTIDREERDEVALELANIDGHWFPTMPEDEPLKATYRRIADRVIETLGMVVTDA